MDIKVGLYSELANLDIVFVPRFDADRFVRGERLSYYNANLGLPAGRWISEAPHHPWYRPYSGHFPRG